MSVARHRRPSRPRPVGANLATIVVLALVVAALIIGVLGGPSLGGTDEAGAPAGAPAGGAVPAQRAEHHEDDHDGLRTTSSLRREIQETSTDIRAAKRALRRCEARSGRAERRCERRARARLRALRSQRERLRRELDRVTNPPATPRRPTRPGTPATPGTPAPAAGAGYSLLWSSHPDARWRCTETLTYRVNLAHAPSNALADTRAAFDLVGSINGYRYVYAGSTTATGALDGTDVVVSWTDGDVDNGGGAIAIGGQHMYWGGSLSRKTLAQGYVRVEAGARLSPGMGTEGQRSSSLGRVLVHEIGHVMGLGHVSDPTQIMYGVIGGQTTAAAAGDRAGLVRQGRVAACA